MKVKDNIVVEGARIGFRNFAGKAGRFNKEGERSFAWFIDDMDLAEKLRADGWNVRIREIEDDGGVIQLAYLNVAVRFGTVPPKIMIVDDVKKRLTPVDEEMIGIFDWAEFANIDMIIRPYNWEAQGRTGVKAYLKTMYVKFDECDFDMKYGEYPIVGDRSVMEPTEDIPFTVPDDNIPF